MRSNLSVFFMPELQHYRHLSLIAAMALFMQSLDATILNTALPAISADLHESPLEMQMAIISYSTYWLDCR